MGLFPGSRAGGGLSPRILRKTGRVVKRLRDDDIEATGSRKAPSESGPMPGIALRNDLAFVGVLRYKPN